jgi:drug/metabolite transporter (DMT)-like permease
MSTAVVILALASAALFALALVLTQLGLRRLSPLRGACISVPTTALLFLAISPVAIDPAGWHPGSAALFALAGCLFPAAVTLLTYEANRRIGANLTAALGNLTPVFAVALAAVLLGEVPRWGQGVGIAIIMAGALGLVGLGQSTGQALGWALALPLAAAAVRGVVQPVVKLGLAAWPDAFAAALIGYLMSATVVLAVGVAVEGRRLATFDLRGWLLFTAIGACNGLAVLSMYAALARGPVAVVAPLVACYPLATLVFAGLLLGPGGITWRTALGVAVTVVGVAVLLTG